MKYIAEYLGDEVEISTNFRNTHTVVGKLNKMGFNLGSGHDGIELRDRDNNVKLLICTPYVGKMAQHITFTPICEHEFEYVGECEDFMMRPLPKKCIHCGLEGEINANM